MPQENQVLRCFSCNMFQVHIVKKEKKWQCKVCNSKQSVKRVYGRGSGKDCRMHVMKLNELQFSKQGDIDDDGDDCGVSNIETVETSPVKFKTESKWSSFMSEKKKDDDDDDDEDDGEFDIMQQRLMEIKECGRRKRRNCSGAGNDKKRKCLEVENIDGEFKTDYFRENMEGMKGNMKDCVSMKEQQEHQQQSRKVVACNENKFATHGGSSKWSAFVPDDDVPDDDDDDDDDSRTVSKIGNAGKMDECVEVVKEGSPHRGICFGSVEKVTFLEKPKSNLMRSGFAQVNDKGKLSIFDTTSKEEELDGILEL